MTAKFDPAPHDKHADTPNNPAAKVDAALEAGLAASFPASDGQRCPTRSFETERKRGHVAVAEDHDTVSMKADDTLREIPCAKLQT